MAKIYSGCKVCKINDGCIEMKKQKFISDIGKEGTITFKMGTDLFQSKFNCVPTLGLVL